MAFKEAWMKIRWRSEKKRERREEEESSEEEDERRKEEEKIPTTKTGRVEDSKKERRKSYSLA